MSVCIHLKTPPRRLFLPLAVNQIPPFTSGCPGSRKTDTQKSSELFALLEEAPVACRDQSVSETQLCSTSANDTIQLNVKPVLHQFLREPSPK